MNPVLEGQLSNVNSAKQLKNILKQLQAQLNKCSRCKELHDHFIITNTTQNTIDLIRFRQCNECKFINPTWIFDIHVTTVNNYSYRHSRTHTHSNPFMNKAARDLLQQAINYTLFKDVIDEFLQPNVRLYYDNALYVWSHEKRFGQYMLWRENEDE